MKEMDFKQARHNMVQQQVRPWAVLDPKVLELLDSVPRERFVSEPFRHLAYCDSMLPIGHHQLTLTPKVIGRILQILQIKPEHTIFEIGTGTGYLTALLAKQAKKVVSYERIPELSHRASEMLQELQINNVQLEVGDGLLGYKSKEQLLQSPGTQHPKELTLQSVPTTFDAIVLTGSVFHIPKVLIEQLSSKGRLFAVIEQSTSMMTAFLVTRLGKERWVKQSLFETAIPPLINPLQMRHFTF